MYETQRRFKLDKSELGLTMTSDDKKIKASPTRKKEVPPNDKSSSGIHTAKAEGRKAEGSKAEGSKAEGSKAENSKTADAAPAGYSRGEGQKPVTQAYKDNWNAIFAKKKKR
jgi:hypothetical protein